MSAIHGFQLFFMIKGGGEEHFQFFTVKMVYLVAELAGQFGAFLFINDFLQLGASQADECPPSSCPQPAHLECL